jgi:hypothetical protein
LLFAATRGSESRRAIADAAIRTLAPKVATQRKQPVTIVAAQREEPHFSGGLALKQCGFI